MQTGKEWVETTLFGVTIIHTGETEGTRSFPGIAAHVTEYARLYLWDIIKSVGRDKVLYCDTDSIAIREKDAARIPAKLIGKEIGNLALDKEGPTFEISGAKDYKLGDFRKLKGIPKNAIRLADDKFQYDQFLGMVSHLRFGNTDGFVTRSVTKVLTRKYEKGIVDKNGKVSPYLLAEG